jgi:hypothetical protein
MTTHHVRRVDAILRWRSGFVPVSAVLVLFTFALYRRALGVGVISDGWELLGIASLGVRRAPFELLSYHTIPVTNLFNAILWKMFGLHEICYQLLNIGELALVACTLYGVGCVLFRQPRIAFLGALLLVANGSFYEIPFWPVVGNFQSLAALLYLAGLLAAWRACRSPRPFLWTSVFALCGLAAFFTYEPAVSVLAVGLLPALLLPESRAGAPAEGFFRRSLRRLLPFVVPLVMAAVIVLGSKALTARAGYNAMFIPDSWEAVKTRVYLLVRGCVALLTLRGADNALYKVITFGLELPGGSPLSQACVALWSAGLVLGGAFLVFRVRTPAVRVLAGWFAIHMLTLSLATPIVSRHFYLGALPSSLLLAWALWWIAERMTNFWHSRASGPPQPRLALALVFLAFSILLAGAKSDMDAAAALGKEATSASRQVVNKVQERLALGAATPRVALVNMPAALSRDGVGTFAFVNGLHPMVRLSTAGRITHLDLLYTYAQFQDGKFANASLPVTPSQLAARVQDAGSLVLLFDRSHTLLTLDRTTWHLPEAYTAESAPYLEWQTGAWPWLRIYPGQPAELPLGGEGKGRWAALRYLSAPGARFTVSGKGLASPLTIRPGATSRVSWPAAIFPLADGTSPARVVLAAETDVLIAGLWSFRPLSVYSPETAPFLSWSLEAEPAFVVDQPLLLPLAAGTGPVRLEVLAEPGREVAFGVGTFDTGAGDGRPLTGLTVQKPAGDRNPEWRTVELPAPPGAAVLHIDPRGRLSAFIRRLERSGS